MKVKTYFLSTFFLSLIFVSTSTAFIRGPWKGGPVLTLNILPPKPAALGLFVKFQRKNMEIKAIKKISGKKEAEKENLIGKLQDALNRIKTLKGIIPICSSCKKIRDDKGYWKQVEAYIEEHSEAHFSHGICEDCTQKLYGKEEWFKKTIKQTI